jgi:hypothetical protein
MATSTTSGAASGGTPATPTPTGPTHEELVMMADASIGAQVILDPASAAALGARGGAGGDIEANTAARNHGTPLIIALSHDKIGGLITGGVGAEPKLHRSSPRPHHASPPPDPWPAAEAQIVSP